MLRKISAAIARLVSEARDCNQVTPTTSEDPGWLVFKDGTLGAKLTSVGTLQYAIEYCNGLENELHSAFSNWNQIGKNATFSIVQVGKPDVRLNCEAICIGFKPRSPWEDGPPEDESILSIRLLCFLSTT